MDKREMVCEVCDRTVVVMDGVASEHRNPRTHRRCKGSSQPINPLERRQLEEPLAS